MTSTQTNSLPSPSDPPKPTLDSPHNAPDPSVATTSLCFRCGSVIDNREVCPRCGFRKCASCGDR